MLWLYFVCCVAPCDDISPCRIRGGKYYTISPLGSLEIAPTVVLMHGWNGRPTGYAKKQEVRQLAEAGLRVILPEGNDKTWNVLEEPSKRDDLDFVLRVLEDAQSRFEIDEGAIYASGFSMGASIASMLGCDNPDIFAAIAPTSGGFFEPVPNRCQGPIAVRHEHGLTDQMWPIEGRILWEGFEQSAIEKNISLWRETNNCDAPILANSDDIRTCLSSTSCDSGGAIEFCTHERGHVRLEDWGSSTAEWLQGYRL